MKRKRIITLIIAVLFLSFTAAPLVSSPQQESNSSVEEQLKIGVIYRSLGSAYMYQGVQYQSFYASEQKLWRELSEEHNFELLEMRGGVVAAGGISAVQYFVSQGVDGIVFCFCDPKGVESGIREAHDAQIPVVSVGNKPPVTAMTPFVGFAHELIGEELGKATAELLRREQPNSRGKLFIANNRNADFNQAKEDGFLKGFRSVYPDAEVVARINDNGSIRDVSNKTSYALAGDREIEVFFGSSDLRALGILNVLRNGYPELEEDAIVASIGGERRAFEYMADPQSPWRVEAGYLLSDFIEQSWNVLNEMIEGKRPVDSSIEYRIPAEIFVDPAIATAEEYLQTHHNINQLNY